MGGNIWGGGGGFPGRIDRGGGGGVYVREGYALE